LEQLRLLIWVGGGITNPTIIYYAVVGELFSEAVARPGYNLLKKATASTALRMQLAPRGRNTLKV